MPASFQIFSRGSIRGYIIIIIIIINNVLIKVTLYHVKHIAGAPYKIDKTKQTKGQNRRQSVVAGRQQLYCAVQSRSPNHCRTTTGKVQSSARDETSSATVHS